MVLLENRLNTLVRLHTPWPPGTTPTTIPELGLPFSLVFRCEPGKEDVILKIASPYEAASRRRRPPPAFEVLAQR